MLVPDSAAHRAEGNSRRSIENRTMDIEASDASQHQMREAEVQIEK
jgi:hypothetical protein